MQTPKWRPDLGFYIFNLYGEQGLIKYPLSCVASAVAWLIFANAKKKRQLTENG